MSAEANLLNSPSIYLYALNALLSAQCFTLRPCSGMMQHPVWVFAALPFIRRATLPLDISVERINEATSIPAELVLQGQAVCS